MSDRALPALPALSALSVLIALTGLATLAPLTGPAPYLRARPAGTDPVVALFTEDAGAPGAGHLPRVVQQGQVYRQVAVERRVRLR